MLAPWLVYAVVTSSFAAAAAVAAELLAGAWRRPRRGVWLAAIALSIGAPILIAVPAPAPAVESAVSSQLPASGRASGSANAVFRRRAPTGDRLAHATIAVSDRRLVQLWFVSSALLLALLLTGAIRLRRQVRTWRLTVIDGSEVLIAPEVGPAVIGLIRPRVVLPEWTLTLEPSARALILQHEREHIRARDSHLLLFAAVSTALLPWNLPLWFMTRRLALAVELDCDQRVLRTAGSVREYGLILLEVVRRREARGLLLGASLIQPRGFLSRRIHAMVSYKPQRPRLASLALVAAIAGLTVAAGSIPRPEPLRISVFEMRRGTPKPRITANWENAPIELVAAAFARFSGRKISIAPEVNGLLTARVDDEPWDEALARIMALHGYRLVVHPDSNITIVADRRSRSENRRVSGRVIDASSSSPIAGAVVNVAGRQAIGEANRTCTTDRGTFELMVPDGEAWLDASAPGYEFSRVIVASNDNRAVFPGRRNPGARAVATIRNLEFRPALLVAIRSKPIIVIDGAVVGSDTVDAGPCARQ